jgi:hypothetical protein
VLLRAVAGAWIVQGGRTWIRWIDNGQATPPRPGLVARERSASTDPDGHPVVDALGRPVLYSGYGADEGHLTARELIRLVVSL